MTEYADVYNERKDSLSFKDENTKQELNSLVSDFDKQLKLLGKLNEDIKDRLSQAVVKCDNKKCGKESEIRNLTYIQTHHYVSPYGCTGGDYYRQSEGQYTCPSCGERTRLYRVPEIEELKYLFSSVVDEY